MPKTAPPSTPLSESFTFDAAFNKLKSFVFSRRIRLEEFFRDLDPLQTGRVVVSVTGMHSIFHQKYIFKKYYNIFQIPSFFRILHLAGYQCSEDEAMALARPFIKPHLDMPHLETMLYTDFLKEIQKGIISLLE